MRVRFWGTRGSIPTPGVHTVRYGGNTPCVEVRLPGDELLILDAGTGIRGLGEDLAASATPVSATLAITHPHWDHIQGLPFFRPLFLPESTLHIIGPETARSTMRQVLSDLMNKTYFPVKLDELHSSLTFSALNDGSMGIPGGTLRAIPVNHPSFTLGYRVESQGKSLVYISDNEPFDPLVPESAVATEQDVRERYLRQSGDPNTHIYDFVRGADILIHDSTYTTDEYRHHVGWGHSPCLFAVKVALEGEVGKLVLFHHDHTHDDETVEGIVAECRNALRHAGSAIGCEAAREGESMDW